MVVAWFSMAIGKTSEGGGGLVWFFIREKGHAGTGFCP
jgi:hypothetical protein